MAVHTHVLIQSPCCRYMIDHDITNRITTYGIISSSYPCFTTTKPHITNNDIMCIDPYTFTSNTYTITRCGLSCYRYIGGTNDHRSFYPDNTRYVKYYYSCATLFTGPAKTSGSMII